MKVTSENFRQFRQNVPHKIDVGNNVLGVDSNRDNIVSKEKLQAVYLKTLKTISDCLANTFGPMGSNTKLVTGNNAETIQSEYTKDGHKVLKHIRFSNPIEMSIQSELEEITHHVEQEVGDGTTSAVILATKIYEYIIGILEDGKYQPYEVIYTFQRIVKAIQEEIKIQGKEATVEDMYDICMISTNGNHEISNKIMNIYKEFGLDVNIDVSISTTKEDMIKVYDGLTISEGYSDPVYINNKTNATCEIHDAHVYAFLDPIDTMDMISLFEKIIMENIIEPLSSGNVDELVPTVIISPKMSRDMSSLMETVVNVLNSCAENQKPPLLVITDISGSDESCYVDIAKLCGCKYIRKYIDPKIKEADEAKGLAAGINNVCDFAGRAELVVADIGKTKFINPAKMTNENGEPSSDYKALIYYLKSELDNAKANGEDSRSIGTMRKRLRSLESNMVEFLVGGIAVADRESEKDLVIDAVKNCTSAVNNGVGYAANYEGFTASLRYLQAAYLDKKVPEELEGSLMQAIFCAYTETIEMLYGTVIPSDKVEDMICESISTGYPVDLRTGKVSKTVKASIMTDIKILEAISKLITIMGTSNQCLLQAPQLNTY